MQLVDIAALYFEKCSGTLWPLFCKTIKIVGMVGCAVQTGHR